MDQHDTRQWDDDDRYCSSHSDDSPILHRYDRHRRYSYEIPEAPERERRSTFTFIAKFFLFCTAMILFCVLMYIPVYNYNKPNYHVPKSIVTGWPVHISRDTKIYVQPHNATTIHEPKHICPKQYMSKNKLFLLIIVCSAIENFDRRNAIRETWGNYANYMNSSRVFTEIRERYKDYNFTYDLYDLDATGVSNVTVDVDGDSLKDRGGDEVSVASSVRVNVARIKRDISIGNMLPAIAKALKNNIDKESVDDVKTEKTEEKRFDDDDDPVLPGFDMNDAMGGQEDLNYDDNYDTNVMKIPPRGFEETPSLGKIYTLLKQSKSFKENSESLFRDGNTEPDFKLVFLLGLPAQENDTEIQGKIEEEVKKYGDVIQEDFVDSYNNLTLKSIMMLKWVTNKCNDSVRYVLKTDDDMYINVPNLMLNLRNRSSVFDKKHAKKSAKEYLLIGDLICGARPVLDSHNKWYSPRYMYNGKMYPRYLSGTGYALSTPAAAALYKAALNTNYFHLEDVFITGICPLLSWPYIPPRDDPLFSYRGRADACSAHSLVTAHRVAPHNMRALDSALRAPDEVDKCERIRLTQVRRDRMRPKKKSKLNKLTKVRFASIT